MSESNTQPQSQPQPVVEKPKKKGKKSSAPKVEAPKQ